MLELPLPELIIFACVIAAYAGAAAAGVLQLLAKGEKFRRFLVPLVALAVTLEAVILIFRAVEIKAVPLTGSFESMIVLSIVFGLTYLFLSIAIHRVWFSSVMVWVMLMLILLAAVVARPASQASEMASTPWAIAHAISMILAGAAAMLATASAVLYLYARRKLKRKDLLGVLGKVPNVEKLERMNLLGLKLCFILLTFGLVSGIGLSISLKLTSRAWLTDPKIVLIEIVWLLLGVILVLWKTVKLKERTIAHVTIVAFALLLFAVVGTSVFCGTRHDSGFGSSDVGAGERGQSRDPEMKIVVLGLNHKTAPVEIREKLAFDAAETSRALCELKSRFARAEFVLLSTCNRVELYCAGPQCQGANPERLAEFLAEFHGVELGKFQEFLYAHEDGEAVRHLLSVASSLDSLVVGEAQIIGQVKDSYKLACAAKTTGKVLNRLFHSAFTASKKVHTTTSIASGRVSVAGVAVELAMQLFADISSAKVVVIGAGDMGQLIVQHLLQVGAQNITVVNRSHDRGLKVADQYGIKADKWEQLDEQLIGANIAIASASVQDYLFRKDSFRQIMARRKEESLLIVDIAVPRNFEPAVNDLDGLYLYSVDDLSAVVEQNRKARERDMTRGMEIVLDNVTEFMEWFGAKDIGPLIGRMKEQFAQIGKNEMERFFVGVREEASCKEVMEEMVNRVVNKLLHCVIKNVNVVAKENGATEAARLVDTIVKQAEEITSEPDGKGNDQS